MSRANKPEFSFSPAYSNSQLQRLDSLQRIRLPRPLRLLSVLIVLFIVGSSLLLIYLPWVQTTAGMGRITALDPRDRVQTLHATVSGRIAQWYVEEGSTVRQGDPIVSIQDIDSELLSRLQSQLEAAQRKLAASSAAVQTAELDYNRKKQLFEEGLAARLDYETARIKVQELKIKEEEAKAALNQAQVNISRQGSQLINAPRDGTVLRLSAGDQATIVSAGQALASFMPAQVERALELFVDGRDVGLISPGRKVRIQFEGWPAFQFSGIPEIAIGTFAGQVQFVEPTAQADGRFRVLITEDPQAEQAWPPESFVRLGAQARAWVLLDTVSLGYELWRQLNNFPPNTLPAPSTTTPELEGGGAKATSNSGMGGKDMGGKG